MAMQTKFRSTLGGGYKKEDVNEYIATMQAEWNGIVETLKNTINRQKEELDALRGQNEETVQLKIMLDEAVLAKEEAETLCEELRSRISVLDEENTALTAKLEALRTTAALSADEVAPCAEDTEAGVLDTLTSDAVDTEVTCSDEELKFKAEQYDRMSANVGAIMLKANANAEEIVARARLEAETLLLGVNTELLATRAKAQTTAETLVNDIGLSVSKVNASTCEEVMQDVNALRTTIASMTEEIVKKSTEIDRKLYATKDKMLTAAERVIRDATAQRALKK